MKDNYFVDYNPFKSDLYSLGLMLLNFCVMKKVPSRSVEGITNPFECDEKNIKSLGDPKYEFTKILVEDLNKTRKKYPVKGIDNFLNILKEMLVYSP